MNQKDLFFEDYFLGQEFTCPQIEFTQEGIIAFAKQHDPRDFHMSQEAGEKTRFKGIIASGFHTLTDTWRSWVDMGIENKGTICGVGLDKVLWHLPVRPGDKTITKLKVIDKFDRKRDGIVTFEVSAHNQDDKLVISYEAKVLIAHRN